MRSLILDFGFAEAFKVSADRIVVAGVGIANISRKPGLLLLVIEAFDISR